MGHTQDREEFGQDLTYRGLPAPTSRQLLYGTKDICWQANRDLLGTKYSFADHRHSRRDRSYSLEPDKQFSRGLHNPNSQLEQFFIKYNCTPQREINHKTKHGLSWRES